MEAASPNPGAVSMSPLILATRSGHRRVGKPKNSRCVFVSCFQFLTREGLEALQTAITSVSLTSESRFIPWHPHALPRAGCSYGHTPPPTLRNVRGATRWGSAPRDTDLRRQRAVAHRRLDMLWQSRARYPIPSASIDGRAQGARRQFSRPIPLYRNPPCQAGSKTASLLTPVSIFAPYAYQSLFVWRRLC
jgi:hypothetical protein